MATSATGSPTPNGIPTIAPSVDAPDGVGVNSIVSAVDTLFTSALKTVFKKSGTDVGTRRALNFIEGGNITLTVADDGANDKVDVTVTASAGSQTGLLSARPLATSVGAGTTYFATDQVVEYISDGTSWLRKGTPAGASVEWHKATAPTGWVVYDGSTLPSSTGIYADLVAHLGGTTTPDTRGRVVVGVGTHADVASVGLTDGGAVGTRRPKHKHTKNGAASMTGSNSTIGMSGSNSTHSLTGSNSSLFLSGSNSSLVLNDPGHSHIVPINTMSDGTGATQLGIGSTNNGNVTLSSLSGVYLSGANSNLSLAGSNSTLSLAGSNSTLALTGSNSTIGVSDTITIGPQTGNEPLDSPAYITALKIAKL